MTQMSALLNIFKSDDLAGLEIHFQNGLSVDSTFQLRSLRVPDTLKRSPSLICVAAFFGAPKCFRYLIVNDADADVTDEVGRNVCHFACCGGNMEIISILYNFEKSFDEPDFLGNTCIHYAAVYHKTHVMFWLWSIFNNESISAVNKQGICPLHIAVANEEVEMIDFLCRSGVNINQKSYKGETPLHFAAKKSNDEVVWALIRNGADMSIKDNYGCLPHQCATFQHIQSILLENGSLALN